MSFSWVSKPDCSFVWHKNFFQLILCVLIFKKSLSILHIHMYIWNALYGSCMQFHLGLTPFYCFIPGPNSYIYVTCLGSCRPLSIKWLMIIKCVSFKWKALKYKKNKNNRYYPCKWKYQILFSIGLYQGREISKEKAAEMGRLGINEMPSWNTLCVHWHTF